MKGGMSQRVQVVDMREITLGNGVFQFKHKDAQWWSGKGKYTFTYKNIPNANLFLIYLDRLTGIRWEQDISEPEEVHHHPGIRGDDLRLDVTLGFREAIFGCKKEVRIQHLELTFNGNLEPNIKKLTITIPSGVDDGTRLRITGEGDAGQSGGESGDLYIYLTASREEGPFRREGIDIVSTLTMTIEQAQQGGTMWVNTIDGEATIVIPAGTKRGDRLRVPGRGVPKLGSPDERGDHIVCVDF
jgi:DnaJ-class molecular chaperone